MPKYTAATLALHAETAAAAQYTLSEIYTAARQLQTDAVNAQAGMTDATPPAYVNAARELLHLITQSRTDVSAYAVAIESQLTAVGVAHAFYLAAENAARVSLDNPADRAAQTAADRCAHVATDTAVAADAATKTSGNAAFTLAKTVHERDQIAAIFYAYRDNDPTANRLAAEYSCRHLPAEYRQPSIDRLIAATAKVATA